MKEIKTWRDREREKVFPRNEVRGSALDSLFVVVVVAIISILTRPSPREKKKSSPCGRRTVTAYCEDTRWMTTIPRFFVEIRRSFENFLLKMTIYMHSASQFPVFVVSVVRSLGFLRQKKFSTRIKGDARFFIVDAL